MRLKPELQPAFKDGRLLIISPFAPVPANTRVTAALAERRNRFVGSLADEVFAAHAHTGSKTAELCQGLLSGNKRVYTINDPANENLISIGAIPMDAETVFGRRMDCLAPAL
jgi:predicted Rossmann fold nucleotide-binding protein DprA/Smf involved in DNA uptake